MIASDLLVPLQLRAVAKFLFSSVLKNALSSSLANARGL
jgi:hypothetical protein